MNITIIVAGSVVGLGLVIVRLGLKGARFAGLDNSVLPTYVWRPTAVATAVGVTVWFLSGWSLASVAAGVATLVVTHSSTRPGGSRDNEDVAEAVALGTEHLRDTLAAAHGLQQTLVATAPHAPSRIAGPVQRLAAKLPYSSMSQSLREFADEINHSSADFVAAALIAATEHEARDLGQLLGHLAQCSREEARMHQRIWVGRSRTRAAVRIISVTVVGFVGALLILNKDYLEPYSTGSGQLVLVAIIAVFSLALLLLQTGSAVRVPERFLVGGE